LFIRFDDQDVRAIFTPRYKPADNLKVFARLDEMEYGAEANSEVGLSSLSVSAGDFNRQSALGEMEKSAVEWAWPQEAGETMLSRGRISQAE
jgi:hypothetical protein